MNFISTLENAFEQNRNTEKAFAMSQYMRNKFSFFGIRTTERRELFKEIWKQNQQEVHHHSVQIAQTLFKKPEREFHYCAIEIIIKEKNKAYSISDIEWIEKLILQHSWWDSIDTIAKYILGDYLQQFSTETENVITRFSSQESIWLHRSLILFQLGYKQKTNSDLLFWLCLKYANSSEFFIQKAIGWALREYAKTNPEAILFFVNSNKLKPLSTKEALKNSGSLKIM
ncbi:DNA alkylation repair protein [Flavobacterium sp. CHNK8]|uniref:DNA alkylation repair protein n=1 Tax=Flavobacterium sp. CHNK8 TaxID=2871165 RepID=UPI001C8DF373|nr:DNA alkylation repair protein [Flavobacterium sp. CHNK8]QZK90062.1 DNA alkylation repair protein [Flavobacterium sp. CHNK8]